MPLEGVSAGVAVMGKVQCSQQCLLKTPSADSSNGDSLVHSGGKQQHHWQR